MANANAFKQKNCVKKLAFPFGLCGTDEVKQFQTYFTDYQTNIASKDHQNSILYSGPDKDKTIYLYLHDNYTM